MVQECSSQWYLQKEKSTYISIIIRLIVIYYTYIISSSVCVCVCARASTHVCTALPCPTLCNPMDNTAHLALLSVEFSRQKNWNELPFPTPGFLPDPGIKPRNWQADSLPLAPSGKMVSSNICCQLHKEIVTLYCLMKIQGSKLYTVISII